ncbi:polysaccharide deacetylase family protein [Inconstantimicrobium mannanitabidum]|uniref:Polysaccharide deacetylase n=1 Tax=Inconstantimicrobium mannanitabidum TaxID=1604901 RepID=A0ACB5RCW6_9CLOT|nr:polysaccharide deacetylase family protein [Clostridium sp. TW13]GKX66985.1 polysaccharide deacetylase [Clostridium sp. TW13]
MKKTLFIIFTCVFFMFSSFSVPTQAIEGKKDASKEVAHDQKVVYITFDDGPGGKVTESMLKTLKENGVHATFFLIGSQIEYQKDLVKKIVDDGNAVGLHSYTHLRKNLYGSNANFLKEMVDCQNIIYDTTGVKTNILRFPFGCNNSFYKLNNDMIDKIHNSGLKVFEWNVDSTDGMYPSMPASKIAKRAQSKKDTAVVLMHSGFVNKNSAEALPIVIKYYKDNGYTFKTLNEDTQELYRIIKKKR